MLLKRKIGKGFSITTYKDADSLKECNKLEMLLMRGRTEEAINVGYLLHKENPDDAWKNIFLFCVSYVSPSDSGIITPIYRRFAKNKDDIDAYLYCIKYLSEAKKSPLFYFSLFKAYKSFALNSSKDFNESEIYNKLVKLIDGKDIDTILYINEVLHNIDRKLQTKKDFSDSFYQAIWIYLLKKYKNNYTKTLYLIHKYFNNKDMSRYLSSAALNCVVYGFDEKKWRINTNQQINPTMQDLGNVNKNNGIKYIVETFISSSNEDNTFVDRTNQYIESCLHLLTKSKGLKQRVIDKYIYFLHFGVVAILVEDSVWKEVAKRYSQINNLKPIVVVKDNERRYEFDTMREEDYFTKDSSVNRKFFFIFDVDVYPTDIELPAINLVEMDINVSNYNNMFNISWHINKISILTDNCVTSVRRTVKGQPFDLTNVTYVGRQSRVVLKKDGKTPYYAKKSKWFNPFKVSEGNFRESVIQEYVKHLYKSDLIYDIMQLDGKLLGCWCTPELCHANSLVALIIYYKKFLELK